MVYEHLSQQHNERYSHNTICLPTLFRIILLLLFIRAMKLYCSMFIYTPYSQVSYYTLFWKKNDELQFLHLCIEHTNKSKYFYNVTLTQYKNRQIHGKQNGKQFVDSVFTIFANILYQSHKTQYPMHVKWFQMRKKERIYTSLLRFCCCCCNIVFFSLRIFIL